MDHHREQLHAVGWLGEIVRPSIARIINTITWALLI